MDTKDQIEKEKNNKRQRCARCKVNLLMKDFRIKRCGNALKTCFLCCKKKAEYRSKRKNILNKNNN